MNPMEEMGRLLSLEGKVAIVAGGGGGIGSAVGATLRAAGARVISVDLPGVGAPEGCEPRACDLRRASDVRSLFRELDRDLPRLDVVVHCAGLTRDAVLWKMDDDDWSDVLAANLDSAFFLLREASARLRESVDGSVVLIASINGERGKFGQSNYAASKAGLIGLGRTVARELGRSGVRVNVIAPGWIDTPMTARLAEEFRFGAQSEAVLGRVGRPEDVASAVLFLVSAMSRHITGQVLRVDGGQMIG